jgi:hypothetical protein
LKKGGKMDDVDDVWVRRVVRNTKKAIEVEVQAGNVVIIFQSKNKKLVYEKYKPEARSYDPAELWVSPFLFKKACRLATAILFPKQKKPSRQIRFNF